MTTPLLALDEIAVNQATKYITANNSTRILEQFAGGGRVISATTSAEPGSPSDGDAYILPASPTGTNWAGYSQNDLVIYRSTAWFVVTPFEGLGPLWVNDTNVRMSYDGSSWVSDAATSIGNGIEDLTTAEVDQLENIGSVTISNAQWGYLGALDQGVATTDSVDFNQIDIQGGITLSGGSDLLDTYEEGTFTPELWDSTLATDPTPPTYTRQIGQYIKIGNVVTIQIRLAVSALGTLTTSEAARIGGLPFAGKNTTDGQQALTVGYYTGMSLGGNYSLLSYVGFNQSYLTLRLVDSTSGGTSLLISEFSASGDILITGSYITD